MTNLAEFSNSLADLVAESGRHLVSVDGRRRFPASGIVWSDTTIVTANHTVQRDEEITVTLGDGSRPGASVVGRDASTDIAVLRVDGPLPPAPQWVAGTEVRPGELVLAVARPGRDVRVSLGVLVAVGGPWRTGASGSVDAYLEPDIVMYPGFSGGALVDMEGRFVGMNTSALVRGSNTTLSPSTLERVAGALITYGRVRRGFLGVSVQPVKLPQTAAEQADQRRGVLLVAVEDGGPAEAAGLHLGDVLVQIDGEPIARLEDLLSVLTGDRINRAVPVRFVRGGEVHETEAVIGERPADES